MKIQSKLTKFLAASAAGVMLLASPGLTLAQSGNPDFSTPAQPATPNDKSAPKANPKANPAGDPAKDAGRAGRIDLRAKFRKDKVIKFLFVLDNKETPLNVGKDAPRATRTMKQEIGLTLRVKDVSATGNASLELVYDSLKFDLASDAMQVSFDSTKPADKDDDMGELLRPIVGVTLTMEADADGNITSISGGSGSGGLPADLSKAFTGADIVKNFFGPIANLRRGSGFASVGESWTNEDTMVGLMGAVQTKNTYTLRSHRASTALVDVQGQINVDPSSTGPAHVSEGTVRGEYAWDTEEGMLKSMDLTMRSRVETQLTGEAVSSSNESKMKITRR